jgi:hypothetical protein
MKCSFLMISPKLHHFSPFFLLIFSPLGTADFFMLLELSCDGYSLLCSKKPPPRHRQGTKIGQTQGNSFEFKNIFEITREGKASIKFYKNGLGLGEKNIGKNLTSLSL